MSVKEERATATKTTVTCSACGNRWRSISTAPSCPKCKSAHVEPCSAVVDPDLAGRAKALRIATDAGVSAPSPAAPQRKSGRAAKVAELAESILAEATKLSPESGAVEAVRALPAAPGRLRAAKTLLAGLRRKALMVVEVPNKTARRPRRERKAPAPLNLAAIETLNHGPVTKTVAGPSREAGSTADPVAQAPVAQALVVPSDLAEIFEEACAALPGWAVGQHETFTLFLNAPDGIGWWKLRVATSGGEAVVLLSHRVSEDIPVNTGTLPNLEAALGYFKLHREDWTRETAAPQLGPERATGGEYAQPEPIELSEREEALLRKLYPSAAGLTVTRKSEREFDLGVSGPDFRAWLPLATIHALNWPSARIAAMTDYPVMVAAGDWSGVRDSSKGAKWTIFEAEIDAFLGSPKRSAAKAKAPAPKRVTVAGAPQPTPQPTPETAATKSPGPVLGYSLARIVRWMGVEGWSQAEAQAVLNHFGAVALPRTVYFMVLQGRNREKRAAVGKVDPIAAPSEAEVAELERLRRELALKVAA